MTKLIAFDLEGVLVEEEFLVELAKTVKKEEEVKRITEEGLSGKMEWEVGLRKRIEILKGVDYETVRRVSKKFTLRREALEMLQLARESGFKIAVISGGFSIFAKEIAKKVNIDYLVSNEFIFKDGKLEGYELVVSNNKGHWLRKFADDCGAEFVIAVGDGENDIGMIREADVGILAKCKDCSIIKALLKGIMVSQKSDAASQSYAEGGMR